MSFPIGPDAFTGANGTELHAYNASWTQQRSDVAEIQSNAAILRAGGSEGAYKWDGDTFTNPDGYVQAAMPNPTNYGGVTFRMTGTSNGTVNGYVVLYDGGSLDLQTVTNGTRANLQTGMGSIASGDTLKLEVVGSSLKVYVNGVQVGTTVTNSAFSTGQPGMYWIGSGLALDLWTADTIPTGGGGGGGSPTYPQLERGIRGLARGVAGGIARSFVRKDRIFVPAYATYDLKAAA